MNLRDWYYAFVAYARRDDGQTMVEYGLILALIALAVVAVIITLGGDLNTVFQDIVNKLTSST